MTRRPSRPGPAPGVYHWMGQEYYGMRTVAKAVGVTCSTIAYHLDRYGHLDNIGRANGGNFKPELLHRPVRVGCRIWPSRKAFAAALGVHYATALRWLRNGDVERVLNRLMTVEANGVAA